MSDTQNPSSPDIARRIVDFLASIPEEEQVKVRTELLYTWLVPTYKYAKYLTGASQRIPTMDPTRPESQKNTDQIEILEENLQQALKDRQSDQSWIQDLESQLGQKNIKIEECGAALRNMDTERVKQIKRLQEDCEERERGLKAQNSELEQEIQDLRKSQQELQRRVSEIFTCAEKKEAELETFKSEYARSHFDESNERQRLELELEKVQANATDMHNSENDRTQIWSRDTSEQEAPANDVRLGQEIQPDDGLRLRTGNSALWNQIPNMGGNTYVEMPVFQKVFLNGISVLATSTPRAKSSYQGDPPEELRPLSMSNATGSNLKLAYVHICRVENDEVFSNGLSSVSNQHFQVYRLCCDRQLALIVVRRGKIKLEELVNIRFGDVKTATRLVQTEKEYCGVV
ncbi:hypothetical protein B0H13DRAFT_1851146 [Mycena leptocephala]|nr:hypothetical protein B0H13DRAFT_1851146 [Mycena leptocephala]